MRATHFIPADAVRRLLNDKTWRGFQTRWRPEPWSEVRLGVARSMPAGTADDAQHRLYHQVDGYLYASQAPWRRVRQAA